MAVGNEHHFVYHCPVLAQVRTDARTHRAHLELRRFIWQDDLVQLFISYLTRSRPGTRQARLGPSSFGGDLALITC